jgi:hypothetical protein
MGGEAAPNIACDVPETSWLQVLGLLRSPSGINPLAKGLSASTELV